MTNEMSLIGPFQIFSTFFLASIQTFLIKCFHDQMETKLIPKRNILHNSITSELWKSNLWAKTIYYSFEWFWTL